jgi:hypothetical protein
MRIGTIQNSFDVPATCTRTGCWVGPTFGPSPAAPLDSTTTPLPSTICQATNCESFAMPDSISNGQA